MILKILLKKGNIAMKTSNFFSNNSPLFRFFGTDPTMFRTTAAMRWFGPEMDFFSGDMR